MKKQDICCCCSCYSVLYLYSNNNTSPIKIKTQENVSNKFYLCFHLRGRLISVFPIQGKEPVFTSHASYIPFNYSFLSSPSSSSTDFSIHLPKMGAGAPENTKILHMVRHAQGVHNVAGAKDHSALMSPEYFDAQLSPLGSHQVQDLRSHVVSSGLLERIQLVITSPLSRTMQTAVKVFDSMPKREEYGDAEETLNVKLPPILAHELCRERLGLHPCDKRKTVTEYRSIFPDVESDDDVMWKPDARETFEEVANRGLKFMNWLWTRPEKEIAIVCHDRFLQYTLEALTNDCQPTLRSEAAAQFKNCELRSLVIENERVISCLNKFLPSDSAN
ncbi:Phosphoglycerate mutase-like protein 1 [Linum perenne]